MPKVTIDSPTSITPNPVPLRRDDQSIMWELGSNLEWASNPPILLLDGGGAAPNGGTYSDWPAGATNPSPIDTGVAENRRPYFVSANKPMPQNTTEWYHYAIDIVQVQPTGERTTHRVKVTREGELVDPDVVNEPKP